MKELTLPEPSGKEAPSDIIGAVLRLITCKKGLYVLDFATGGGKTYNVFDLTVTSGCEHYDKIIYLVPQKKQRDNGYEEYRKAAARHGIQPKECLVLESNVDHLLRMYEKGMMTTLHRQLETVLTKYGKKPLVQVAVENVKETVKTLSDNLKFLSDSRRLQLALPDQVESVTDEWAFRLYTGLNALIKEVAADRLQPRPATMEEHLSNVAVCREVIGCICSLYPQLEIYEKRVIICTATKYMYPLKMMTNPELCLYNDDLIKNSLVILDESDAIYKDMKKVMLEAVSSRTVQDLYAHLKDIFTAFGFVKDRISDANPWKKRIKETVEWALAEAEGILSSLQLDNYASLLMPEPPGRRRLMMFSNNELGSILPRDVHAVTLHSDRSKQHLVVDLHEETTNRETGSTSEASVLQFAVRIMQLLTRLAGRLGSIIESRDEFYSQQMIVGENRVSLFYRSKESSVKYILGEANLQPGTRLYNTIVKLGNMHRYSRDIPSRKEDFSIYNMGWVMLLMNTVHEQPMDGMKKQDFCFFTQNQLPEKLLVHQIEQQGNTVILLSATAGSESLGTNFNLKYLHHVLRDSYYKLSKQVTDRFQQAVLEILPINEGWRVTPHMLPEAKLTTATLKPSDVEGLFPPQTRESGVRFFGELANRLELSCRETKGAGADAGYYLTRYYKFFYMFRSFCDGKQRSGICFCPPRPGEGLSDSESVKWSRALLTTGCALIEGRTEKGEGNDGVLCYVTSENYDRMMARVCEDWSKGKKRLIVTSYRTMGAGMNLDYPVPEGAAVKGHLPQYLSSLPGYVPRQDVEMVCLMEVTGYREYTKCTAPVQADNHSLYNYIVHLLALQYNGHLSYMKVRDEISMLLSSGTSTMNNDDARLYNDMCAYRLDIVKQALGRICRTTLKGEETVIWYDASLQDCIVRSSQEGTYTYEFLVLKDYVRGYMSHGNAGRLAAMERHGRSEQVVNQCNNTRNTYNRLLGIALSKYHTLQDGQDERQLQAQAMLSKLQEEMLRNPDGRLAPLREQLYCRFETPVTGYYAELRKGEDSLVDRISLTPDKGTTEVNIRVTGLDDLMKVEFIREYFKQKGYATRLQPSCYLLQPYLMLSVYKGLIGETAFDAIVKHCFGLATRHLRGNMYETGDRMIEGVDLIWDVKNYRPDSGGGDGDTDLWINLRHKRRKADMPIVTVKVLCTTDNVLLANEDGYMFLPGLVNINTGRPVYNSIMIMRQLINNYKNKGNDEKNGKNTVDGCDAADNDQQAGL